MGYLGYKPADKPLTAADITDGIITSAKIVDGTIVNADINASAAIAGTKLTGVGKVLKYAQVSSGNFDASAGNWNITSTTLTNTGRTVTFTPTSASSIITGSGFVTYGCDVSGATSLAFGFKLCRDSGTPANTDTEVGNPSGTTNTDSEYNASQQTRWDTYRIIPMNLYDNSHNTTSAITYRLYAKSASVHQNRGGMLWLNIYEIAV